MALLERVATLLRANLNDLLDKAEDPAAMLKQLLRDMENQLLQVKTQVAIAIADQHVLERKRAEHEESMNAWRRKAELALAKGDEPLARAALERSLQSEQLRAGYDHQLEDQRLEAELLRQQYRQLEAKLAETSAQGELLLAAQRRSKRSAPVVSSAETQQVLGRMRDKLLLAEAAKIAQRQTEAELGATVEERLRQMEQDEKIDTLLAELKRKPHLLEG